MSLRLENVALDGKSFYSVIHSADGVDRLVIQTSNSSLASMILSKGWTDGSQIPKSVMEKAGQRPGL